MEKKQNMTQSPLRVEPQAVTTSTAPTHYTRYKANERAPTYTHKIIFEEKEYTPPILEAYPGMPNIQPMKKYPTMHKMVKGSVQ